MVRTSVKLQTAFSQDLFLLIGMSVLKFYPSSWVLLVFTFRKFGLLILGGKFCSVHIFYKVISRVERRYQGLVGGGSGEA